MLSLHQKTTTKRNAHAFTLVELIVVITILAILGTIGFLSIGGYSSRARDSGRLADVTLVTKTLDLGIVTSGSYPTPDNYFTVTYSGWAVWYQGTVGNGVVQKLHTSVAGGGLDARPTDPLKGTEFTYSTLAFGKAYQVKADYEGDPGIAIGEFGISQAYAAPGAPTVAYIKGNYGGLTAKTETGSTVYVVAIPSIVTSTGVTAGSSLEIKTGSLSGTLLFNGKNLTGASSFNPGASTALVFSGASLPKNDTTGQITAMMAALKTAYTGSDIASNSSISTLLNTATGGLANLGTSVVTGQLGGAASNEGTPIATFSGLYAFTTHTFNNCSQTGKTGPSLAQCQSSYVSSEANGWKNTYLAMSVNGIQRWTVPATASYQIVACWASGNQIYNFGKWACVTGTVSLNSGDILDILVGQLGVGYITSTSSNGGTAGGGSYVVRSGVPLIIAGGGAGGTNNGSCGTTLADANIYAHATSTSWGGGTCSNYGGGGGGFTSNGNPCGDGKGASGRSYANGGIGGGPVNPSYGWATAMGGNVEWGFGGGAAASEDNVVRTGGGGGANGGNAEGIWSCYAGVGGTSFSNSTLVTNNSHVAGQRMGHGSITITKL